MRVERPQGEEGPERRRRAAVRSPLEGARPRAGRMPPSRCAPLHGAPRRRRAGVRRQAGRPAVSHPLQPGETRHGGQRAGGPLPRVRRGRLGGPREGGLCHRLDIETSGVLLAARTREAWTACAEAFGSARGGQALLGAGHRAARGRGRDRAAAAPSPAARGPRGAGALGGAGAREATRSFRVLARAATRLVEVQHPHRRAAPGARAPGGRGRAHRRRRAVRRAGPAGARPLLPPRARVAGARAPGDDRTTRRLGTAASGAPGCPWRSRPRRRRLTDTGRWHDACAGQGSTPRSGAPTLSPGRMGRGRGATIRSYLRQLREERGLTQSELARGRPRRGQRAPHRAGSAGVPRSRAWPSWLRGWKFPCTRCSAATRRLDYFSRTGFATSWLTGRPRTSPRHTGSSSRCSEPDTARPEEICSSRAVRRTPSRSWTILRLLGRVDREKPSRVRRTSNPGSERGDRRLGRWGAARQRGRTALVIRAFRRRSPAARRDHGSAARPWGHGDSLSPKF